MNTYIASFLEFSFGLALFLYSMGAFASHLKDLSARISVPERDPGLFKSFLWGTGITALIQSSSAATVMAVGLVGAGMMSLSTSSGVIIGANLGTTVTPWLISLSGVDESLPIVRLLSPEVFAPMIALVSVFTVILSKREKTRSVANVLLTFSLLMAGINIMSDAFMPLTELPSFNIMIKLLSRPLFGILSGAFVAALIQSSSASVGILQALAISGAVPYSAVIPVVMGQNIGTCTTALIAASRSNQNAKSSAFFHLYYNLIGVGVISIIFYLLQSALELDLMSRSASAFGIALIQTLFNLASVFLLVPFVKQIEKLSKLSVKEKPTGGRSQISALLDKRFLASPSFALSISKEVFLRLTDEISSKVCCIFEHPTDKTEGRGNFWDDIEELRKYLFSIDSARLSPERAEELYALINASNALEGIALGLDDSIPILSQMGNKISKAALRDLDILCSISAEIVYATSALLKDYDSANAHRLYPMSRLCMALTDEIKMRHTAIKGGVPREEGALSSFGELVDRIKVIVSCCQKISSEQMRLRDGRSALEMHEYMQSYGMSREFEFFYSKFKEKYALNDLSPSQT